MSFMDWVQGLSGRTRFFIAVAAIVVFMMSTYNLILPIEQKKTEETVAFIKAQKLTLDDVMGKNLPPEPDPALVNATVEGVDANRNGIRDDVELAIFKKYPNDSKIRAAELQYAMGLQMELTQVFNTKTLVAVIHQTDRGHSCLYRTGQDRPQSKSRVKEVESLVYNTPSRLERREEMYQRFMTSIGATEDSACDVDVK